MVAKRLTRIIVCLLVSLTVIKTSNAQLHANFGANPIAGCAPLVVNFTDSSTGNPVEWKWNLGNSTISFLQNPSATYFNPGTYNVQLVVTNAAGTKDSIVKTQFITVYAAPTAIISATPQTGCYPLPVSFTDGSTAGSGTITNWLWDFGDGASSTEQNPLHVYTASGNYNVSLMVTNSFGCTKTITMPNFVSTNTGVDALFTHSLPGGCSVPETITFQNQSTGTGTLAYSWTFGDGGTSTAANPSHTYTAAGSYNVMLVVTNSTGCTDTFSVSNTINIGVTHPEFTFSTPVCAESTVSFTNTSTPVPASATWTFGDGGTAASINAQHIFNTAGTYNVKMTGNFGGCADSVIHPVTVIAKPVAAFTGDRLTACSVPLTVSFSNTSTGAVSYNWDFGDGGTSTATNPSHTYTAPGAYNVSLIVTNAAGCSDTLTRAQYINITLPTVTINDLPRKGCAPLAWTFTSAVNSNEPVATYLWNFGDGTTSTAATPTHVFPTGSYDITVTITTASGCTATTTVSAGIIASTKPQANFSATPRDACAKETIMFTDLSTGTVTGWHWDFGDGGTSTEQNPSYVYSDTGYFHITLIVDNNGCKDTLRIQNYIHINPPIAAFNIVNDCATHFTKSFIDESIGADEWHWDFGDGSTSTLQNPVHTYTQTGNYTVTLTVVNHRTGCDYTTPKTLIVADERALFTSADQVLCRNTSTQFTATSQNANPMITGYSWDFGNGTTATGNPATATYTTAGTYAVRLIISDPNGCLDTLIRNNYIAVYGPTADFTPSTPGSCLMTDITFNDQSVPDATHPINQWSWDYGDGITENLTAPPFVHGYTTSGIFSVKLKVTDTYGCTDSITKVNLLTISNPEAVFASVDTNSCPGKDIRFTNGSTGPGLTYQWTFGDGTSSSDAAPVHVYNAEGVYTVSLTVTDMYGCVSTLTKPNYINIALPHAAFTVSDSVSTCPPLVVQFTNASTHVESFVWDFGDGGTSQALNPSHFYNIPGTYFARLTVTSPGGCVDVFTKRIIVRGPYGSFTYAPLAGCSPLTVSFVASTRDRASFIWDFNDGTTVATSDSLISHTYTIPGIYVPKMILKDIAGCTVPITGPDTIKVSGVQADFITDTTTRCTNGNVVFTNLTQSNDVITSYLWNFGDGTTSTAANPTHFYAALGNYRPKLTVRTQNGCVDSLFDNITIRVVKTPEISITNSPNGCVPLTMSFNGNLINPDTSAISWHWTTSDGGLGSQQQFTPAVYTNAGTYSSRLIAINSSGCADTAQVNFEAYGIPAVDAGLDMVLCLGTPKQLTATGAASYRWFPSTALSCPTCSTTQANPDSAIRYYVEGTSAQGCKKTDSLDVVVRFPFKMRGGYADTLCTGGSTLLMMGGASTYEWSPATGLDRTTGPRVKAAPTTTTRYMVIGKDNVNCFSDTAYFPIKVYPIPTVSIATDTTMTAGRTCILTPTTSSDVTQAVWSPNIGVLNNSFPSITVKPTSQVQYRVRVSNPGGCTAEATINVNVLCDGTNVFIPNTFSPNGDGQNDVFFVRGTGLFKIKQATIFNRWGQEVFSNQHFNANDAAAGWDGTFRGTKLEPDVYVYMIEVQCENNNVMLFKGNVTLLR